MKKVQVHGAESQNTALNDHVVCLFVSEALDVNADVVCENVARSYGEQCLM